MELYGIYHTFYCCGDDEPEEELVALCEDKNLAEEYVRLHSTRVVYDTRDYGECTYGELRVEPLPEILVVTEDTLRTVSDTLLEWQEYYEKIKEKRNYNETYDADIANALIRSVVEGETK